MKRFAIAGRALRRVVVSQPINITSFPLVRVLCFRTGPNLFRLLQVHGARHSFNPQ